MNIHFHNTINYYNKDNNYVASTKDQKQPARLIDGSFENQPSLIFNGKALDKPNRKKKKKKKIINFTE